MTTFEGPLSCQPHYIELSIDLLVVFSLCACVWFRKHEVKNCAISETLPDSG